MRSPLDEASLDEEWTLVMLDPPPLDATHVAALRNFVEGGGRLVAGGGDAGWADDVVDGSPEWSPGAGASYAAADVAVEGVASLETAGEGRWTHPGTGTVLAGTTSDALAVEIGSGAGTVVLLADVSFLQNRLLDHADNAGFALALAGEAPGPVVFAEEIHGYGPPEGLSAFPARWRWAGAGFAVATGLWMWGRGRRLGPPEQPQRVLPPARREYVEALAATLARAQRREGGSR